MQQTVISTIPVCSSSQPNSFTYSMLLCMDILNCMLFCTSGYAELIGGQDSDIQHKNHSQASLRSKELKASDTAWMMEKGYLTSRLNSSLPNLPNSTASLPLSSSFSPTIMKFLMLETEALPPKLRTQALTYLHHLGVLFLKRRTVGFSFFFVYLQQMSFKFQYFFQPSLAMKAEIFLGPFSPNKLVQYSIVTTFQVSWLGGYLQPLRQGVFSRLQLNSVPKKLETTLPTTVSFCRMVPGVLLSSSLETIRQPSSSLITVMKLRREMQSQRWYFSKDSHLSRLITHSKTAPWGMGYRQQLLAKRPSSPASRMTTFLIVGGSFSEQFSLNSSFSEYSYSSSSGQKASRNYFLNNPPGRYWLRLFGYNLAVLLDYWARPYW